MAISLICSHKSAQIYIASFFLFFFQPACLSGSRSRIYTPGNNCASVNCSTMLSAMFRNASDKAISMSGISSRAKRSKLLLMAELMTSPRTCSPSNRLSNLTEPLPTDTFNLKSLMRNFSIPFSSKYLSPNILHAPGKKSYCEIKQNFTREGNERQIVIMRSIQLITMWTLACKIIEFYCKYIHDF